MLIFRSKLIISTSCLKEKCHLGTTDLTKYDQGATNSIPKKLGARCEASRKLDFVLWSNMSTVSSTHNCKNMHTHIFRHCLVSVLEPVLQEGEHVPRFQSDHSDPHCAKREGSPTHPVVTSPCIGTF